MTESIGTVDRALRLAMERRTELLAYAGSIVLDWAIAEDIFQEALVVAARKGAELPDAVSFGRWIREVVRRLALEALNRRRRAPRPMSPKVLNALDAAWEEQDGRWSGETRQALRQCMRKLGPKARCLVQERYENQLTGDRLAKRLGLTIASAYATLTRIHRALETCVRQSLAQKESSA